MLIIINSSKKENIFRNCITKYEKSTDENSKENPLPNVNIFNSNTHKKFNVPF